MCSSLRLLPRKSYPNINDYKLYFDTLCNQPIFYVYVALLKPIFFFSDLLVSYFTEFTKNKMMLGS